MEISVKSSFVSLMEEEMKFDLKELHEAEEKNGRKFDFVRMSLADLNGISRTSVVPRKHLENYLLNGFHCTASNVAFVFLQLRIMKF